MLPTTAECRCAECRPYSINAFLIPITLHLVGLEVHRLSSHLLFLYTALIITYYFALPTCLLGFGSYLDTSIAVVGKGFEVVFAHLSVPAVIDEVLAELFVLN